MTAPGTSPSSLKEAPATPATTSRSMFQTESSRIPISLSSGDTWQDPGRFTPRSQFMINTPRDPASSPEPPATADGAAAPELRTARAIGRRNAIDQFPYVVPAFAGPH